MNTDPTAPTTDAPAAPVDTGMPAGVPAAPMGGPAVPPAPTAPAADPMGAPAPVADTTVPTDGTEDAPEVTEDPAAQPAV